MPNLYIKDPNPQETKNEKQDVISVPKTNRSSRRGKKPNKSGNVRKDGVSKDIKRGSNFGQGAHGRRVTRGKGLGGSKGRGG